MKVNLPIPREGERSGKIKQGGVYLAQNFTRKSERFDKAGNVINPITKAIIKRNNEQE
jgi:hypothetical protein